ncbi:MAG TPA: hypothetical protein VMW68_07070 [Methyloceanibacter sp.]|nr:hypothetical protein [Methyloceanibacter sp.]
MQPSHTWKPDDLYPPLEEPVAHAAAPEDPAGASSPSSPDLATLLERFNEPLNGAPARPPATAKPAPASSLSIAPPRQDHGAARAPAPARLPAPAAKKSGLPIGGLISGVAGIALVPVSFLFFLSWQDAEQPVSPGGAAGPVAELELSVTGAPAPYGSAPSGSAPSGLAQPAQSTHSARSADIALSAPDRIEATEGGAVAFPIAIDAATALPARSLIAVAALPQGASFSQGRPYGDAGWSLRPDELAGLQLRLPTQSGSADMRLELISGDGTVLSQTATALNIMPPQVATVDEIESTPAAQIAQAEQAIAASSVPDASTGAIADPAPAPQRKPASPATPEPEVKVNTVKTVTVQPPRDAKPYDGAYALGAVPEDPAEWMETKTAVDMHASAEQKSETVKVADGGLKVRVTARDKNWVQVTDPASATTGWIYNRFLKDAEAPAE